jgi:hypothetical protein
MREQYKVSFNPVKNLSRVYLKCRLLDTSKLCFTKGQNTVPEDCLAEQELLDQIDQHVLGVEPQGPLVMFLIYEGGIVVLLHTQFQF